MHIAHGTCEWLMTHLTGAWYVCCMYMDMAHTNEHAHGTHKRVMSQEAGTWYICYIDMNMAHVNIWRSMHMAHMSCAGLRPSYIHACVYVNRCEHDVNVYVCMCMCVRVDVCGHTHKCMHTYTYKERERERERVLCVLMKFKALDLPTWFNRSVGKSKALNLILSGCLHRHSMLNCHLYPTPISRFWWFRKHSSFNCNYLTIFSYCGTMHYSYKIVNAQRRRFQSHTKGRVSCFRNWNQKPTRVWNRLKVKEIPSEHLYVCV